MRLPSALSGVALALLSTAALALDYRSVTENAVLYDAPSTKGVKHLIVSSGTPVEVVLTQDRWTKVRESAGNMVWIETSLLSNRRTLLVRTDKADVRSEASDKSTVVFSAEKNVLLDLVDPAPPGWAKVRHRDGQTGFVRASQVWGL